MPKDIYIQIILQNCIIFMMRKVYTSVQYCYFPGVYFEEIPAFGRASPVIHPTLRERRKHNSQLAQLFGNVRSHFLSRPLARYASPFFSYFTSRGRCFAHTYILSLQLRITHPLFTRTSAVIYNFHDSANMPLTGKEVAEHNSSKSCWVIVHVCHLELCVMARGSQVHRVKHMMLRNSYLVYLVLPRIPVMKLTWTEHPGGTKIILKYAVRINVYPYFYCSHLTCLTGQRCNRGIRTNPSSRHPR